MEGKKGRGGIESEKEHARARESACKRDREGEIERESKGECEGKSE